MHSPLGELKTFASCTMHALPHNLLLINKDTTLRACAASTSFISIFKLMHHLIYISGAINFINPPMSL